MQLKLLSEQNSIEPNLSTQGYPETADFPSVRYFQIHFEFLQEQLMEALKELRSLQIQIKQLEQQLPATLNRSDAIFLEEMSASPRLQISPITSPKAQSRR